MHWKVLLLSWAGWTFDFYDLMLYSFLLLPIGKELHLSNIALGYVLGSSLAATAAGGVVFGILADKFGRKKVLSWTVFPPDSYPCCVSVSSPASAWAENGRPDRLTSPKPFRRACADV
jgi:MFS family permease